MIETPPGMVTLNFEMPTLAGTQAFEDALRGEGIEFTRSDLVTESIGIEGGILATLFTIAAPVFFTRLGTGPAAKVLVAYIESRKVKIEAGGYRIEVGSAADLKAAVEAARTLASSEPRTSSGTTASETPES